MKRFQKFVALVLSLSPVGVLTACGGSGSGGGNSQNPTVGTITLISVAPSPILGCAPVPYTISGTNFETVTGTTARVTWRALGGQTPFLHGTSDHVTTIANVTSDTTIDGLSPDALLCGVPSVTVELDVTLESGVTASSTGIFTVVINAPTIVSIAPNPLPAAIATPFVITGTGFPAAGGPVTIRFTGDAGALLFNDGTHNYVDVQGLVTSTTTIAATSPIATVCGVDAVNLAQLGASIQLFFPDGCCTLPTAPGFVNFVAPAILSLVPNSIPAELPPANVVLNGTNFGPPNTVATVRLVADNNVALFNDGTLNSIDVPGLIGPGSNTVTFVAPTADVCGVASRTATLRVIAPYGSSCRQSSPAFVTFTAPVITTVNGLAQATVPASIPTAIAIQGTGFGPANGVVAVTFISDPAGPPIFGDGTQIESAPVQGVINGAGTQITVTTPHATVQGAASRLASVRISYQGGSCASSPAQFIQFTAATLTGIAATAPTAGTFFAAVPSSFTLSGTNFGPVGSEAFVRFIADNGATPFGNGTQNAFEVPGTVTAVGTITGVAPLAALCPQTTLTATVRVLFQDGGQTSNTAALTFTAPTISFAPATFAGSVANAFTITGTGFGPANSLVAVKFTAVGGATPFGDGTMNETTVTGTINGAGTQITGLTPLAALCGVASITATVTTTFQGGACASTAVGAVTITAPTIDAGGFAPNPVPAATPTAFTITGTGFGTNGQLAQVAFSVTPPAAPFNNGSASEAIVTGTVGGGGTTITGFTPAVAACPNNVTADVRVTLQNGACTAIASGLVTFLAPTVTTNSLTLPLVSLQNPGLFTINGTNFGPIGGQALVRWTANSAIFADGTNTAHDAPGTITSATTITTNLPVGRLCTTNATASVRVVLPMGACGDSPAAFVTWTAPVLTTTAPASTPAYAPAAISITGTTFPAVGTPVAVTFSGGGQVWNNGTSTSVTVLGTVNPANTVTVTPPAAYACATVTVTPTLQFGATNGVSGGCSQTAPTFTMNVPATTAINPGSVSALSPSAISLTGTNFPAAGTTVQVRLLATAPAGATPFAGGTQSQIVIPATVNPANTITFTPPVCCITANTTVSTNLTFQNANCEIAGLSFTLNAPTITTVAPATEPELAPTTPVTITGTNFPTAGTPVQVTFSGGGSPWNGGTTSQTTVLGTVTTSGTVITVANPPAAQSCATFTSTVTVTFPAASASGCPLSATGPQYVAPAVTTVNPANSPGLGTNPVTVIQFTGTNFPAVGTPASVTFVDLSNGTPFGGGTLGQVTVTGTVTPANTVSVNSPLACVRAGTDVIARTFVTFGNVPCQFAGPNYLFSGPFAGISLGGATTTLFPGTVAFVGGGFPPNASVTVRLTATAGTPFAGGTSATASVPATVNAAGTQIGPFAVPTMTTCPAADVTVNFVVDFPQAPCSLAGFASVGYLAPTIGAVGTPAGGSYPAFYRGVTTLTTTSAQGVPVGTPVLVRYASTAAAPNDRIFGEGTLAQIDVPGVVSAANTVTVAVSPQATICGAATAAGTVQLLFPDGSCTATSAVTFNAPQVIAAGVTGFQPQNLSYEGNTPFTIFATAGVNDFSNIVGQNVDVVFQNASPIFRGGTSTFDIVSGVVATSTTITGSAPNIVLSANESSALTILVRFEDGSCTNSHTSAQYFRADTLLAVGGTAGLSLISTNAGNPYGAAANAAVAGSPIAGASVGGVGGVAVDPTLNKAFSVNGTNLVVVDLAGPAATSPAGTPVLTGTALTNIPLGANGAGIALDASTHRVYVLTAGAIVVVNGRTNTVVLSRALPVGAVPTGALLNDSARRALLIPSLVAGGIFRYDTISDTFGGFAAEPTGLGWNGGTAVGSAAGRVYLAYPGAGALGAVDAATLTNVLWVAAAPGVLTPVLGVDETANVVATGDVAAVVFLHAANTGAFLGGVGIPAPATAIVGPGPVGNRLYVSQAAGGVVSVIDSFAGVVVGGVGVAGASAEFATSP